MAQGTESAWTALEKLPPAEVCRQADVRFDPAGNSYLLKCYGRDIRVCPGARVINGASPVAAVLLGQLRYFSELAILWYLAGARAAPLAGVLIRPTDLKAGRIFAAGSHVLPLDELARKYGADLTGFFARGRDLGGAPAAFGDAALRLLPFPRVPVIIILWRACAEFKARADLLFDSSCELQLPQDIVWATAMLSIRLML